jgi:hypothetical protein
MFQKDVVSRVDAEFSDVMTEQPCCLEITTPATGNLILHERVDPLDGKENYTDANDSSRRNHAHEADEEQES